MDTLDTAAAQRWVSPQNAQLAAEDAGRRRTRQDPGSILRALSAVARWVWAEPLSTESPTPFIDAHPRRWPDGAPSRWWPDL
jgi:hypothetical protein